MNISFKNIAKRYKGNIDYTLENINLEIKSKEFVAFLGPSGCGKTTLLRMVAGLNSITKGDLLFDKTKVNNIEPKDRNLAMVFQSYALYPHLSVYKNMAFSLEIRKISKSIIDRRVKDVAKILEIDHLLFNKPSEISGGQRQRVALGRAIVRKPSIFLMDEPLSNLDAKLREIMRIELVKIHKMLGVTTLYVTHDQLEAMTMADKIVIFNNRKIQQIGAPADLYNKPANLFVASFIGSPSMNLIEIDVNENNKNGNFIINSSLKNKLSKPKANLITLGIRSEDIKLVTKKPINKTYMHLEVLVSELLGKETIVTLAYTNKKVIQALVPGQVKYEPGAKMFVLFNEQKINLFDSKTKKRITI